MIPLSKQKLSKYSIAFQSSLVLLVAYLYGLREGFAQFRAEWLGFAALSILGGLLLHRTMLFNAKLVKPSSTLPGRIAGWIMLFIAAAVLWETPMEYRNWAITVALWLLGVGISGFFNGLKVAGVTGITLLFLVWGIPFREQILLVFSFPLRLASTELATGIITLFGQSVESTLTTIRIPGLEIAITDACSGIQQVEAMLLVGYFLVFSRPRRTFWHLVHYATLLPSIIIANALRIAITVFLFGSLGEAVLESTWHVFLGYAQTILSIILLYSAGYLLPEENNTEVKK